MKYYEITFVHPNQDWTWKYIEARDYHQAILRALHDCPDDCRVQGIQFMTAEQVDANRKAASARSRAKDRNEA